MLKTGDFKFPGGQSARVAEQLPLANLDSFAKVRVGQVMLNTSPNGVKVIVLASSRSQPVTLENTRPAIEQFLLNERKRELVTKDVEVMRDAANIHYVRKYAEGAASAASPVASALVPAPAPAASGVLSEDDINKGMGPKK